MGTKVFVGCVVELPAAGGLVVAGSVELWLVEGVAVEVLVTTTVEPLGGTVSSIVVSGPFGALVLGGVAGGIVGSAAVGVPGGIVGGIVGGRGVVGSRGGAGAIVMAKKVSR